MPPMILMVLKMFGWKTLLKYGWRLAKPQAEKAAKRTDTDFDDEAVKLADEIIGKIVNTPGI